METELRLYTVSTDYINYLKRYQPHMWDNEEKGRLRPYVGVIIEINGFNYYAPLSSPKPKHTFWKDRLDFVRIDYKGELKGVINIGNMVPVDDSDVSLIDIDNEEELYRNLLNIEMIEIRKKKELILNNANSLYIKMTLHRLEAANAKLATFCYDFVNLEKKMIQYNNAKKQAQMDALVEKVEQIVVSDQQQDGSAS